MEPLFWVFYLLDYVICVILSFIFIRYYANKKVPTLITILSRLFVFANYLLIFTLPYEIIFYNAKKEHNDYNGDKNITSNIKSFNSPETNTTIIKDLEEIQGVLVINYAIIFWVLVTLSNQLILYLISFEESGEFTFCRKLFDSIKKNLIITIVIIAIISIISLILGDIVSSIFIYFNILNIFIAFILLGVSIVKLPRIMYIHSNTRIALEYYEFKANKKLVEFNKNNEELQKNYFICKQSIEYVKNIEEYLKNDNNIKNGENENEELNEEEKKETKEANNDNIQIKGNLNNEIINDNNVETINNGMNEEIEEKDKIEVKDINEDEKKEEKKEEKKDEKDIKKDYNKHKSFIKYKKYLDILFSNLSEIIKKYNIDITKEKKEEPVKEYKKIVEINGKSKIIDADNERINSQIKSIYKKWAFLKEISLEENSIKDLIIQNDIKDINSSLKEEEVFIPSSETSQKKIQFYKKYNRALYLSLMIIFIILGTFIMVSEISLSLPINISIFSLIFTNIKNKIIIHILVIFFASLIFIYISYSFGKIKYMGRKYILFGGNKTNSLGLLSYCQKLSTISFPVSMNVVRLIFHKNVNEEEKTTLEEKYGNDIGNIPFYKVSSFISLFLIVVIIYNVFDICGINLFSYIKKICKKKKISFNIKNEFRTQYISEGKLYLMKLNKNGLSELDLVNECS